MKALRDIKDKYLENSRGNFILEDYIYAYKHFLEENEDYNSQTLEYAKNELHHFDRFLELRYEELENLDDISARHISEYVAFNKEVLFLKDYTVNVKLRYIRKFFDYLANVRHVIEYNPAYKIEFLKLEKSNDITIIPKSKLDRIFSFMLKRRYGIRDVLICKILAYTGIQIKEVLNLKIADIDFKNKYLKIKRDEIVTNFSIPSTILKDLNSYLELRKDFVTNNTDYLFLSNQGNKYSSRYVQYTFKNTLIDADIAERYTPRHLKSTFAYNLAKKVDKEELKKILNQDKVDQYYFDEASEIYK